MDELDSFQRGAVSGSVKVERVDVNGGELGIGELRCRETC